MATWRDLPERLQQPVRRETEGELIRWLGRPSPWRAFLTSTPVWLFGIPWLGFALFWEAAIVGGLLFGNPAKSPGSMAVGMAWVMAIFGIPFVAIGIAMVLAPLRASRTALRTVHMVTDRRVISMTIGRAVQVTSIGPDKIQSIRRTEWRDGSGHLSLTLGTEKDSEGGASTLSHAIHSVPDVRKAERMIAELGMRAA